MTPEKRNLITSTYPKIFSQPCELSVGDGWYQIIFDLCQKLQQESDTPHTEQITATQVKEKFGGLRFYVDYATDVQYALITEAEDLCEKTCEVCGAPGTARTGGWIKTLCDEHAK